MRRRQIKNFLLTLADRPGRADAARRGRVPAQPAGQQQRLLPGQRDELGRLVARCERNDEIFRFARGVLALRRAHPVLRREAFYTDEDIRWFNPGGNSPDWFDPRQKCLACLIRGQDGPDLYLMFNADTERIDFRPAATSTGGVGTSPSILPSRRPATSARPGKKPSLGKPIVISSSPDPAWCWSRATSRLSLKGASRFLSGAVNVENPVHAHELEERSDLFR